MFHWIYHTNIKKPSHTAHSLHATKGQDKWSSRQRPEMKSLKPRPRSHFLSPSSPLWFWVLSSY